MPHGGQILVDALKAQGIKRVFCVPGESYLAALDGLYESGIDTIVARQEGGAAMMAEAHGKLTGTPGICFVTRGPGATNASAGVHVAFQDSTPMILFVGQVASDQRDREAFQEVDYRAMFGPLAKWVAEIDRTDRIPEYISRAFHVAQSGRPGPVVLALPEDVLSAKCEATVLPAACLPSGRAAQSDITAILDLLSGAERPLVLAGGPGWSEEARQALERFAEVAQVPVVTSLRCQDYMDNHHRNYVGDMGIGPNPDLAERLRAADVLLCLGARLGEMTTSGYTLLTPPNPQQKLIHVHPDPSEPGHVFYPTLAVTGQAGQVVQQLAATCEAPAQGRGADIAVARASYDTWQEPQNTPGTVKMERVMTELRDMLPDTAILTNGAGNYCGWLHRYYRWRTYRTQLAPTSGSMGYGLPAGVAAALEHPDRPVICFAGDGCFQMTSQEFGTACEYGAKVIVLVVNNGMYGTIRMHQQGKYPGRVSGTRLKNPDFAALARSYGALGLTVTDDAHFRGAMDQALAADTPALIELQVDPRALSTRAILRDL
ncbi:thiamine pyrophosphate-binding protein [Marinovum sp. 2_MG-2023]|uniref:thiamine pyrophosphate-binding protein n=1 Tax=unclassified Marinovum TaxID=2647166 RepID=UPI0026E414E6|nr:MULTISPECIES: thiamine pyrophosphate-binding protein [unclassified Marinovum]MDO6729705.1 thiamine pyrophosphate-binding protein [Marinovum sp. 2_MG-2023]MDO6779519.1 thiamine pyrophosphate-binding protein [Marinovum sp. 1_MG-2023]